MAPRAERQRVDAVLLLDKPVGPSSNQALQRVRWLLGAAKAGHGGTLDPMASGLLPVALGEATKFLHDLLEADKTYEAVLELGTHTDSGDAEGEVLERRPVLADDAAISAAVLRFVGPIRQIPPMHSALKRDGKPLYAYAREGLSFQLEPRAVTIHALTLRAIDRSRPEAPRLTLDAHVSKGTYIRALARDLGETLGCGAHLVSLRRTRVGRLFLDGAIGLDELERLDPSARRARLQPVDALVRDLERIDLSVPNAQRFGQGQTIRLEAAAIPSAHDPATLFRIYCHGQILGVARMAEPGRLSPVRVLVPGAVSATQ